MSHYSDDYDKDDFPKKDSLGGIIYLALLALVLLLLSSIYFTFRYHNSIPNLFSK